MKTRSVLVVLLVVAGLGVWWVNRPAPRPTSSGQAVAGATSGTIAVHGSQFQVSGPFTHKNLAVFVLHSGARDETDFLTLDEGLATGAVEVSEKPEQQVNELEIENRSGRPLFVQVGDRLRGGKQDRIVGASFVVPPRSGKQPIRSFCVEHDRWAAANGDVTFACCVSSAVAPNNVRAQALASNQQGVWDEVARSKAAATNTLKAPSDRSTLNETLDSAEARKGQEEYVGALGHVLDTTNDAVGVAFVLDGKVEEVDVYPGETLLKKLYPRLLSSFALRAATASAPVIKESSAADIERFLAEGQASSTRREAILGNSYGVQDFDKKVEAETDYQGRRFIMATGK
jgi:hypothetical protein